MTSRWIQDTDTPAGNSFRDQRNELRYTQPGKPDQNVNIDSPPSEREEIFAWIIDKAI